MTAISPNRQWLEDADGSTVRLEYRDGTEFDVTVERRDDDTSDGENDV